MDRILNYSWQVSHMHLQDIKSSPSLTGQNNKIKTSSISLDLSTKTTWKLETSGGILVFRVLVQVCLALELCPWVSGLGAGLYLPTLALLAGLFQIFNIILQSTLKVWLILSCILDITDVESPIESPTTIQISFTSYSSLHRPRIQVDLVSKVIVCFFCLFFIKNLFCHAVFMQCNDWCWAVLR